MNEGQAVRLVLGTSIGGLATWYALDKGEELVDRHIQDRWGTWVVYLEDKIDPRIAADPMARVLWATWDGRGGPSSANHEGRGLLQAADARAVSQDEKTGKIEELPLAVNDQGAHREPGKRLANNFNSKFCNLLENAYPSIVVFVKHSDQRASTKL